MHTPSSTSRFVLRDLPLAARLTLALFLVSTGIGYLAALVQVHFQHASPGNALPTGDDSVRIFHGQSGKPVCQIERLLTADEKAGWNGTGSMAGAFTTKSSDWKKQIRQYAKKAADESEAESTLRRERDGERLAILAWIDAGATKADYEKDAFSLPDTMKGQPVTADYVIDGDTGTRSAKIKSILTDRCVRCHTSTDPEDAKAGEYPLETYEQLKPRVCPTMSSAMSPTKLAQTTHVHLLGFSMLYGLTGLILAFSSYPAGLRVILCPLPLLAQIVDIAFWWLARLPDPHGSEIARLIAVTQGVVAVGLLLHIVLSLFDLFGSKGKFVLTILFGAAAAGAVLVHQSGTIERYLSQEKAGVESAAQP
jgi:hypothetical protein